MDDAPQKPKKANKHLERFFLGWQNRYASELIIVLVVSFAVTFIVLGFVVLHRNSAGFTHTFDYTDFCRGQTQCTLPPVDVPGRLASPVYVRYQVNRFYQNHFRFQNSVPKEQLINGRTDRDSNSNCGAYLTNSQMNKTLSVTGRSLDPNAVAIPCGVMAFTFFNDEFSLFDATTGQPLPVSHTGIAWQSDREFKFKNVDLDRQWIDATDQRFITWMRISPYNEFVKSWGVADDAVKGRRVSVVVANRWNADRTQSRKMLVLSTGDFYGSPNPPLAIFFLVFGFLAAVFGLLLVIQWAVARHDKFFRRDDASEASNEAEIVPTG